MSILKISKSNFETEVLNSEKPVLIDFWAGWCGPCNMISPVIEEIASENEQFKVCKVNVDEEPELAHAFGISSIPALIAVKDGKIANQLIGVRPKDDIMKMMNAII